MPLAPEPGRSAAGARRRGRIRKLARSLLRTFLVVGLAAGAGLATADASSADGPLHQNQCRGVKNQYAICLYITDAVGQPYPNHYRVVVGIDVAMPRAQAEGIIQAGVMNARLFGSDVAFDDDLIGVTRREQTANDVFEYGFSATFERIVAGSTLNEDPEGVDEVFAKVTLYYPSDGRNHVFSSPKVVTTFN